MSCSLHDYHEIFSEDIGIVLAVTYLLRLGFLLVQTPFCVGGHDCEDWHTSYVTLSLPDLVDSPISHISEHRRCYASSMFISHVFESLERLKRVDCNATNALFAEAGSVIGCYIMCKS